MRNQTNVTYFLPSICKILRITSLSEENRQLKIKVEEGQENIGIKQSMLNDANTRLYEVEEQLDKINAEHNSYKEKAKRILYVRIRNKLNYI